MSLELVVGCMFSGKSTEIVRMVDRFKTIDAKYLLVKPQIDNRYSMTMVQTHTNQQRTCEVRRQLLPLFSNQTYFVQIHKLLPVCDNIRKLKAYCLSCKDGTEAIFSKRIVEQDGQTCIGAADKYMAVCRECFLK